MIKRLHLESFKNFTDASLDVGPLTLLVGTNAAGKSNVRDAFRVLHGIARRYTLADVAAMLASAGKPNATVKVCTDPLLGGVSQAMRWERLEEIVDRYRGMVNLFVLCVDRDGEEGRRAALDALETRAAEVCPDRLFLAEHAWQEIEVWVLAGHRLPREWSWADVRAHRDPKEAYYLPFAATQGVAAEPAEGRKRLAVQACQRYDSMRSRCPELKRLEQRIADGL